MTIKLALAITTHNSERYIRDTIHYALTQSEPFDEIILVDDCSSDATVSLAERALLQSNKPYTVIKNHVNTGGPAHSRNIALTTTFCQYVAFLDADDCCIPTRASSIRDSLSIKPCDCLIHGIYEVNNLNYKNKPMLYPMNIFRANIYSAQLTPIKFVSSRQLTPASSLVLNKSIFPAIRFNESDEIIAGEDKDLVAQIVSAQLRICNIAQPLVIYNYFDWRESVVRSSSHITSPERTVRIVTYFNNVYGSKLNNPSPSLTISKIIAYVRLKKISSAIREALRFGPLHFAVLIWCLFSTLVLFACSFLRKFLCHRAVSLSSSLN
jgi:glycosyltransferase involved in cell wall biosynthesis